MKASVGFVRKKCCCLLVLFAAASVFIHAGTASETTSEFTLWYQQPAKEWVEALPVGNGRLGAMVFGGVAKERLQFNEDTLWTGVPRDYINPKAKETLPKVRRLLFEGKQKEAQIVANDMMSVPLRQEAYQPFGDIIIEFPGHESFTHYKRDLNLDEAIAHVSYQVGNVTFRRDVFSSHADQVMVCRLYADQPRSIDCIISKTSPHSNHSVLSRIEGEQGLIVLSGQLVDYTNPRTKITKPSVLKFESRLQIRLHDGKMESDGQRIHITNASEVVLVLAAATSYKNFRDIGNNPAALCEANLKKVQSKSFNELKTAHVRDYQELFHRMSVDFGKTDAIRQPTDQRIKNFGTQADPQLVALYMQYGRYLLISSSRSGSQPANLQGIWNEQLRPPWDSKWTTNINTEMNYWPAEICNLSECHEPLFDLLDDVVVTGGKVAREHYGCRGWVLHHNTDIWRGAAPINASNHGIWVTGGAWLCQHLWFHYAFTQDREFLEQRAYPIMKGAAQFFVDFLVEDPRTGWLISTPSNSPENGGLVAGPTMDHQIIRNLFSHCIEASEILGVDKDFRHTLKKLRKRIAPNQIGKHGQLQEWLEDKDDPNNHHRHVSHLWGLHPGNEITPLKTPDLAEACRVTLSQRGDGGTGWSKAWKVNFWARLLDGNHSFKMFSELVTKSTLPNMFDTHPPFQIDGNFGGTSGIAEMLLQSHAGEIHLLPSLPDALPEGRVKGLCARGGFVIDMEWSKGELDRVAMHSTAGNRATVRYRNRVVRLRTKPDQTVVLDRELKKL